MKKIYKVLVLVGAVLALLFFAGLFMLAPARKPTLVAKTKLSDGRILQVEAVTYGTDHKIGSVNPFYDRFSQWLPQSLRKRWRPKVPPSNITMDEPGLVVWVNALDPDTGTNVDCQGIRVEFVDEHGDLFATRSSSWHGGDDFWRVGHIFDSYPRDAKTLTLLITSWKSNSLTSTVEFPNPHVTPAAAWTGQPLPQQQKVGSLEIALTALELKTNGGPRKYWETPAKYWQPVWELRRNGQPVDGWKEPEWTSEDPTGNRSQHLGGHQPVLRFTATVYPKATNMEVVTVIATLPEISTNSMDSNIIWNTEFPYGSGKLEAVGCFPKGMHTFYEGKYTDNPPAWGRMGPTSGGAKSGWVGSSRRVSPVKVEHYDGHYTPGPVIYLKAPVMEAKKRLALRLRDEQGRYWVAESGGIGQGIMPFMFELPPEVKKVVPEVVELKPVEAVFSVKTGNGD